MKGLFTGGMPSANYGADAKALELKIDQLKTITSAAVETSNAHLDAIVKFALAGTRGLFLLNGAAAITALAKTEINSASLKIITCGAIGASFAVACGLMSYLSQCYFSAANAKTFESTVKTVFSGVSGQPIIPKEQRIGDYCRIAAIVCALASIGVFFYGLYQVHGILEALQPHSV